MNALRRFPVSPDWHFFPNGNAALASTWLGVMMSSSLGRQGRVPLFF
jgi:hypothetical protein